ncbi:MAG: capsular biosynthesis protein CpsI [Treponema sp.]|nr:MAG: capsular biosynthesis protein CpsI [Treponema sp.]
MTYFITGVAGFIGYHLTKAIIKNGDTVVGMDSVNDYYSTDLKNKRLDDLKSLSGFVFYKKNIEDKTALNEVFSKHDITQVIHLAAQAGVRYSLENPYAYGSSNLTGFLTMLETARQFNIEHFLFASSSSVYGLNKKTPYSEKDAVDHPISLYAATKKANEVMAHSYSHLYGIPMTGLRFFTVYGPMGRPDMAYFKFAELISANKPIDVYNNGELLRDFTYIDDVVEAIMLLSKKIPVQRPCFDNESAGPDSSSAPFEIYNIGNESPENLLFFIETLEKHLEKKAVKNFLPMQAGDVYITSADTQKLFQAVGWKPSTPLEKGLEKFCNWFKSYKN